MMIYGLLLTVFVIIAFFLVLIILVQQAKGSVGIGGMGGQAQMIFGGSGGQDIFQKITWGCVTFFMFIALLLALMKSNPSETSSRYLARKNNPMTAQTPAQSPSKMPEPMTAK